MRGEREGDDMRMGGRRWGKDDFWSKGLRLLCIVPAGERMERIGLHTSSMSTFHDSQIFYSFEL